MITRDIGEGTGGIFKNLPEVFPSDFFNIQNPNSPWVSVQFRTDAKLPLNSSAGWQEITLNPSNFFDKLTVEDAGGFQSLAMTLVDKEFTRLENIVIQSIATVNNVISKGSKTTKFPDQALPFKLDKESLVNIRVRFGYSELALADGSKNFIDVTSLSDDVFMNRVRDAEKTVIRSPWIYFMINDVNFQLNDFGLMIEIKAWSITSVMLDQAKMMKVFAIYRNTPEEFFLWISKIFEDVTGITGSPKKLVVDYERPVGPLNTNGTLAEVTIELGNNATINMRNPSFISIREMLNIFCGKITPKTFKKSGDALQGTDNTEDLGLTSSYSYVYKEGAENEPDRLIFYYPDPTRQDRQTKMRNYFWREYGTSIVRNFSVSTNTNFAALNAPIPINDITSGNMNLVKGRTEVIDYANSIPDRIASGSITDVETKIDGWIKIANAPDDYALVSSSIGRSSELDIKDAFHSAAAAIVSAINDQVFNGSLTIAGDPFYFFDDNLRPMEYVVQVVILRPAYINDQGIYTGSGSSLQKSYLSGHYLLKKITHTIDINGYSTTLDVMRSPLE